MNIKKEVSFTDEFQSAFEYAAIGMAIVAPDGTWLKVNKSMCKIVGYTENQLKKVNFQSITHPDYLDVDLQYVEEMLQGKRDYYEMEKIYIHKDGSYVWALLSVSLVFKKNGEPKFFISQIQDITQKKIAEQKLKKLNNDLSISNQQLEEYAHVVSHDLKEPLRAASYYADFLLEDYKNVLDKEGVELIRRQKNGLERMRDLLDKVLYLSKVGREEVYFEQVDMNKILSDLLEQDLKLLINEQNVEIKTTSLPVQETCNSYKISEVFSNLIINAIKYNKSDHKIVHIGYEDKNKSYFVEDNGIGIDKVHEKDVYQIFRRVHAHDDKLTGTGVGLTIVKKIIERHGGSIWFERSQYKTGTKYSFKLQKEIST